MVTSRAYAGAEDLERLIKFLVAERKREPIQRWHVGDLIWRMFYSGQFDPTQNVRLWEDRGEVVGFGWLYPPSGADLQAHDLALLPEMIAWAQGRSQAGDFYAAALTNQRNEDACYEAHGFQAQIPYGHNLRRKLEGNLPAPTVPEGFTLRSLAGDGEAAARAEAHRLAFDSQAVTDEGYAHVIHAPIYDRELDLLVIAPDGRIAAFCLCWLDTVNRVGLFEPVGTHPDYRRLGLARAVMTEGMRRMQARGMETALVSTAADNAASQGLYRAMGFEMEASACVYLWQAGSMLR